MYGTREVAQWLRALALLLEDPNLIPCTHAGQLTTTCRFSSRIPGALFWPRKGALAHQDNETNGKMRLRVAGNPTLFWLQRSSSRP